MEKNKMSAKEFQELGNRKVKELKYKNKPSVVDGRKFASLIEAEYYGQLKLRARAGDIKSFKCQVPFSFVVNGILVCTYFADFVIYENDGSRTVIDTKGEATAKL